MVSFLPLREKVGKWNCVAFLRLLEACRGGRTFSIPVLRPLPHLKLPPPSDSSAAVASFYARLVLILLPEGLEQVMDVWSPLLSSRLSFVKTRMYPYAQCPTAMHGQPTRPPKRAQKIGYERTILIKSCTTARRKKATIGFG